MTEEDEVETQLQGYLQSLRADGRPDRGPPRDEGARRQRILPHLRAHITRERKRVQRRRAVVRAAGLIALGAGAATAFWYALPRMAAVRTTTTMTTTDLSVSIPLAQSILFEAPADRPARVRVGDTVTITLAPGSRARPMVPAGATSSLAIALESGRAHFEVQKLHGDRRFHVMTLDADVEVRGTVFDVALLPPAGAPTCVSVDEGLVQVAKGTRTRLLARGESWDCDVASDSTNAAPATEAAAAPTTPPADEPVHRRREIPAVATAGMKPGTDPPREIAGSESGTASVVTSDLRAQNQIFQAALSAQRAGQAGEAVGLYRQLLARAPDGPLAAQSRANLAGITARAVEREEGAK
jgi:ferric-dicitrate binding protein FerR (iron transport regulator)